MVLTNVTILTALMSDCKLYNVDYMITLEMKSDATLYNIDYYSDEK